MSLKRRLKETGKWKRRHLEDFAEDELTKQHRIDSCDPPSKRQLMRWIKRRDLDHIANWPTKLILDELNDHDLHEKLGGQYSVYACAERRAYSALRARKLDPNEIEWDDVSQLCHIADLYDACKDKNSVQWEGDPDEIEAACQKLT